MNLKSMRISMLFSQFTWLVTITVLVGVTLAALLVFRLAGPLRYSPVAIEGLAPTTKPLLVYDSHHIQQTFQATVPNLSHVGVHIANDDSANNEAVLSVDLLTRENHVLGTAHALVRNLRADDVTILPLPARLEPAASYTLQLRTQGVASGSALRVFYEQDSQAFPNGRAKQLIQRAGGEVITRALTGNIRFQIIRFPTPWLVANTLRQSRAGWFLAGYAVVMGLIFIFHRRLGVLWHRWAPALPLALTPLKRREWMRPTLVGLAMAATVTAPYYTQLEKITTSGDVQRALVYRAVARTALLNRGEMGLWEPYLCGGEPLLANMESAQLDPFFLLVLLFGENLGTRLSVTATLVLGFVGAYFIARRFGVLDRPAALLAASIFSFSGFQMLAFANGNFAWIPVGWIPWVVYFFLASLTASSPNYSPKTLWRNAVVAALMLAFIFWGGSLHLTLYAMLACGVLALFLAPLYQSWRPLLVLALIGALFIPLVAIKLVPVDEIQALSGEFDRPPPFIQPWSWFGKMFWDRHQLDTPQWRYDVTGENFRWIEYGTYIGITPLVLVIFGAVASRDKRFLLATLGAALLTLLMTFGEFPWTVLHRLPFLYGPLRNPQRARVVLLLFFGLLAGYGLMVATKKLIPFKWPRRLVTAILVALVLLDLATFHTDLYPQLFSLDRPLLSSSGTFVRLHESYTEEKQGYYKVSYENYRAGQSVVDMCMPYMMQRGVYARGQGTSNPTAPYFGEAMLTSGGEINGVAATENTMRVTVTPSQPGWLVLNQNFFPGWRTSPPREVINWNGLVAARVTPDDREVLFRYRPLSYVIGAWITLVTIVLYLIVILGSGSKHFLIKEKKT